ncbi:MAG: uroporphyrinogen decarboxylase family protein [Eggerthellaceae bacterium]|nr:uroporphyrinogen decarboxylase family protein [Eggerthellaceae bacterium]
MAKDSMTPAERGAAIANGEQADRLPCNPNIANGTARVYGCKISEFNSDPQTIAKAQMATYERFGSDSLRIFTDLFTWAEAMGAKVVAPEDNTVDLETPAVRTIEDIDRLEPADPYKDGRLPVHIESMKYLKEYSEGIMGCSAGVVGPFTNAFFLYGVDDILKLCHKNKEAVHKLCQVSLETCKAYAAAAMDIGLGPTISEPMSSCTVVSPKVFRELSLPYLKQLVDFIHERGFNPVIHICGQTDRIWKDVADLGVAGWSIDNVASIEECKATVGDQCKIMGNVDPGSVMYAGTPLDVRIGTLTSIKEGYDNPKGYVCMSGCSLPVETPFENIDTMMDTVREVGYPVDPEKVDWMLDAALKERDGEAD